MLVFSILNIADGTRLLKVSNLFVFSYDGCGFLDLQLCFLQLPPEHFLQLGGTEQREKNIK